MRNPLQLPANGLVNLGMIMPMKISPDRGVAVQILAVMRILQFRAPAFDDNDRLLLEPVPHLGEWMPQVSVIQASQTMHNTWLIGRLLAHSSGSFCTVPTFSPNSAKLARNTSRSRIECEAVRLSRSR